jgi:hypothetical protein
MWSSPLSDDESYLLLTLREWTRRGHLYDHVYSQYGPFYYLLFGLPSRVFGITWTIDAGRITNLALWSGSCFLLGLTVWKVTARIGFGLATLVLTFSMLSTLVNEPMHPGALLCVLLAALVANVAVLRPRRPGMSDVLSGALVAALVLTKLNVGAFAGIALAFVVVEGLPATRSPWWRRAVRAAFVATGPVLLLSNGVKGWEIELAAIYVAAAAAVLLASSASRRTPETSAELSSSRIAFGFFVIAAITIGFTVTTGSTAGGLWNGIVRRPFEFSKLLAVPINLPAAAWAWLVIVPLAGFVLRRRAESGQPLIPIGLSAAIRILGGAALISFVLGPASTPGLFIVEGGGIRFALLPLVALVLVPRTARGTAPPGDLAARRLLAAAAVIEALMHIRCPGARSRGASCSRQCVARWQ